MKFIIITQDGMEHRYVVQCLLQSIPESVGAIFIESHDSRPLLEKVSHYWKRYGLMTCIERCITKSVRCLLREKAQFKTSMLSLLGHSPDLFQHPLSIKITSANTDECLNTIQLINPDYILVYGTGIIKSPILSSAKCGVFNMHTGISPQYRGADCVFWPLYYNDLTLIGATVHECTATVDGGRIFKTGSVHLTPEDNQYTAFAASVKAGAKLYQQLIKQLLEHQNIHFKTQTIHDGREFVFTDRTFLHDFYMLAMTKTGVLSQRIRQHNRH